MAYCWKEEFEVRNSDGNDVDWFDNLEDAIELASENEGYSVVRLRHYQTDYDTVWPDA